MNGLYDIYVDVMEQAYILVLEARFCGFDSHRPYQKNNRNDIIIKNVFKAKDNRLRMSIIREDGSKTSKSYPRVIMEEYLGRELLPDEDVHHIDGDVMNNSVDNLQIIKHGEHQRLHMKQYFDKQAICQVCGKQFLWTAKRQSNYYRDLRRNKKRIISCSKNCSSYVGRMTQLNRDIKLFLEEQQN